MVSSQTANAAPPSGGEKLAYFLDYNPPKENFLQDVLEGLSKPQKSIPPKYFYDAKGSALFDRICQLDEYYVTRTEIGLLESAGAEIGRRVGRESTIVEYGSGSSTKIRLLLDQTPEASEYAAIDISRDHLVRATNQLAEDYPDVTVGAICADFLQPIDLPDYVGQGDGPFLGFFPGSTIGNFSAEEALQFLKTARKVLKNDGALLIGVDLKKDPKVLEAAYNDEQGVTAEFNLNLLTRINNELNGTIDEEQFEHRALFNDEAGRIEMHLISKKEQEVKVGAQVFSFEKGESIHTENSKKYAVDEFVNLAERAGYNSDNIWTDPDDLFSLHYLKAA